MSDDPTKNIEEKFATKPTLETILERINLLGEELRGEMRAGFAQVEARFDTTDKRLDDMDSRLKKMENKITLLNEDMLDLRGDMRELKREFEVHDPRRA